jgi:hypothetical protein
MVSNLLELVEKATGFYVDSMTLTLEIRRYIFPSISKTSLIFICGLFNVAVNTV